MESVKAALASALATEFGPGCVVELDIKDRCVKMELPVSRDHVIYVRPDDYERHFLCHYTHKADLAELLCDPNGDSLAWKQRNVAQLARKVKGAMPREFVTAAMWYARQAAARMEQMKGLGGRRADAPMVETFAEIKSRMYHDPEPKKPEVVVVKNEEEGRRARKQQKKNK